MRWGRISASAPGSSPSEPRSVSTSISVMRGRRMTNSAPRPGPSLVAAIVPPCISTRFLAIVRPTPMPASAPLAGCGPWKNSSNTRGSTSGAIPEPSSFTRITTASPSRPACSSMQPPRGE